jgi:hypothetical protein
MSKKFGFAEVALVFLRRGKIRGSIIPGQDIFIEIDERGHSAIQVVAEALQTTHEQVRTVLVEMQKAGLVRYPEEKPAHAELDRTAWVRWTQAQLQEQPQMTESLPKPTPVRVEEAPTVERAEEPATESPPSTEEECVSERTPHYRYRRQPARERTTRRALRAQRTPGFVATHLAIIRAMQLIACDADSTSAKGVCDNALVLRVAAAVDALAQAFVPLTRSGKDRGVEAAEIWKQLRESIIGDLIDLELQLGTTPAANEPSPATAFVQAITRHCASGAELLSQGEKLTDEMRETRCSLQAIYAEIANTWNAALGALRDLNFAIAAFGIEDAGDLKTLRDTLAILVAHGREDATRTEQITTLQDKLRMVRTSWTDTRAEVARWIRQATAIRQVAALCNVTLPRTSEEQLLQAERDLRSDGSSALFATPINLPTMPEELATIGGRIEEARRIIARAALPRPPSVFKNTLTRQEELRRLMMIAMAEYAIGLGNIDRARKNRGGIGISKVRDFLLIADLVAEHEAEAAKEAVFQDRKKLFIYTRDRRTPRFLPTEAAFAEAVTLLEGCRDKDQLLRQLAAAERTWSEKYREERQRRRTATDTSEIEDSP